MGQTIKARYHDGMLEPLEPLPLPENAEVEVTIERMPPPGVENILQSAARVYRGLSAEDLRLIETLALDRRRFFRDPAA